MSNIPTIEDLFKTELSIIDSEYPELGYQIRKKVKEFAKLHVQAALERAYVNQGWSWTNSTNEEIKKELFYKNSYPLTNIK